jgi:hypothetical protein
MTTAAEEERLKELNRIRVKRCRDKKVAKEIEKAAKEKEMKEKRNARDRERYARNKAKNILLSSAGRNNNNNNGHKNDTPLIVDRVLMESLLDRLDTASREARASLNHCQYYEIDATNQEAAQQHIMIASVAQLAVHIQQLNSIIQQFIPAGSAMMRNGESATDIIMNNSNYDQGRVNHHLYANAPTTGGSFIGVAAAAAAPLLDGQRDVASHFCRPQGNNNNMASISSSASATINNKRTHDDETQVPDLQMGGENSSAAGNRRIVKATKPQGTAPSLLQQPVDIVKPTDGTNHYYSQSNKKLRPIVDTKTTTSTTTTTTRTGGPVFGSSSVAMLPSISSGMNARSPLRTGGPVFGSISVAMLPSVSAGMNARSPLRTGGPVFGSSSVAMLPSIAAGMNARSPFFTSNEVPFSMGVGRPIPGNHPRINTEHLRTSAPQQQEIGTTPLAQQQQQKQKQKQPTLLLFGSHSATPQEQNPGLQSNQQIDGDDF